MKKSSGLILKIFLGIIVLILLLLFIVPVVFKEQIRTKVEKVIGQQVNANVSFRDYKLGFFRNFPNLSFSLNQVAVVGVDKFENDTLAAFKSMDLVFNLASIFKKSGYEVKSVKIDQAVVNAIVRKEGAMNWDIMKDTVQTPAAAPEASSPEMKIRLENVSVTNSSISYIDDESAIKAYLQDVNFNLSGDMTMSQTDLRVKFNSGDFTYIMDGTKYLNKAVLNSDIDVIADLDKWKFTFGQNYVSINDLKLNFTGSVIMPGDDIETDLKFESPQTSFKTLLSLIPAVYMKGYEDLKADGTFTLSGSAKGVYSDADSTLPDIALAISVKDGMISYPSLPEKIKNISLKTDILVNGKDLNKTEVNVDHFHMELAGNPFDMTFALRTPVSDPDFKGSMVGRIDLSALSKAVPMDSITMSGIIDMSVRMAGKMSMIEKSQYDQFSASGTMGVKNMAVAMKGYPEVQVNEAAFEFTPAYAALTNASLKVGEKSDFKLNGRIENYIPYVFSKKTIKGKLSMQSALVDANDILSKMAKTPVAKADSASKPSAESKPSSQMSLIRIPLNIDFDFDANIGQFNYNEIKASKLKGHIILHNGILSIKETGMDILGGTVGMDADYDTRDTLKPSMKGVFNIQNIVIRDAFSTFNTVKKLAPSAKGLDGKVSARINYTSLLGQDMMPVTNSINGSGNLKSDEVTLLESKTFDQMKSLLKAGDKYSNTFKDINVSFKIADGRVYVSPFDVKTGNLKMNISGDQGLDQTLNYIVKTEMPRSDLGGSVNSLLDNLSASASALGIKYKVSDVLKVNVKVTGTFAKPIVTPYFGNPSGEASVNKAPLKEAAKQSVNDAIDKTKDKARADAEAEGDRLIKEAEIKGQQIKDQAAKTAEDIRKEADVQAKKLTDDAANKNTITQMAAKKGAESLQKNASRRADQIVQEADVQSDKLVEEAKLKKTELLNKI